MAKVKTQKAQEVAGIADRLNRTAGAVFADFAGLKVAELEELRRSARGVGCEYLVVKKTLFRRAASDHGVPVTTVPESGSLSVLFGFADPVAPARLIKTFAKAHAALKVLGGLIREELGIRSLEQREVATLGDLPSVDELRHRLVGSLASPLRSMVGVMQGNLRSLVHVLNAVREANT